MPEIVINPPSRWTCPIDVCSQYGIGKDGDALPDAEVFCGECGGLCDYSDPAA